MPPRARFGRIVVEDRLPRLGASLVVLDARLPALSPRVARWLRGFERVYPVRAGERLKTLRELERLVEWAAARLPATDRAAVRVVAVGGGSVGDFAGFFASVWRRGVDLVLVPSTWLAAIDSAHGGKTALNAGGAKNVVGTFHPAVEVRLVRELLELAAEDRATEAWGELAKVAILDGGAWTRRLRRDHGSAGEALWRYLVPAIRAKLRIVARDPEERTGVRGLLNLGHTTGHVLEAWSGVPHGVAVAHGTSFAVEWSRRLGLLSRATAEELDAFVGLHLGTSPRGLPAGIRLIPRREAERLLARDKKAVSSARVREVFVEGWGRPRIEPVRFRDVLAEMTRQGWVES